jgi:hypothetical protein
MSEPRLPYPHHEDPFEAPESFTAKAIESILGGSLAIGIAVSISVIGSVLLLSGRLW